MDLELPIATSSFSEADVRGEILEPLLKALGYGAATPNKIRREVSISLRYPRVRLGRKKSTDPLLRGVPDFILGVGDQRNWVLEAKGPTQELTIDDVEQAFTYANHPEIRAVLFVLTNGITLQVFETSSSPEAAPLLTLEMGDLKNQFAKLYNLLSPEGVLARFPQVPNQNEFEEAVAGHRWPLKIVGGYIHYDFPRAVGLSVIDGAIERTENGLLGYIETVSSVPELEELNSRLGIKRFEAISSSTAISTDAQSPTEFSSSESVTLSKGEVLFDLVHWHKFPLPHPMTINIDTQISGYVNGNILFATFFVSFRAEVLQQRIRGRAELRLG